MTILSSVATTSRHVQFWGSHFNFDWIEPWSLEQKEAIQMWMCEDVSSNVRMFFGRPMNILNHLQVVKRVELGIEKICGKRKVHLISLSTFLFLK